MWSFASLQQVELPSGVLIDPKAETLQRVLTEGEDVEGMLELENRRQCLLQLGQVLVVEALVRERLAVDVGRPIDRAGADDVLDDILDLVFFVAQVSKRRRHRLIGDLEVTAAGQLLELDQGEVGLHPGGVAVHQ